MDWCWAILVSLVASLPPALSPAGVDVPRVRAMDAGARELLDRGRAQSPTVQSLVTRLSASDVLVLVRTRMLADRVAFTAFAQSSTPTRTIVISIDKRQSPPTLLALLGHELQHAAEIAADRSVSDAAGLKALFTRIGREVRAGRFETIAAREAELAVTREIARH